MWYHSNVSPQHDSRVSEPGGTVFCLEERWQDRVCIRREASSHASFCDSALCSASLSPCHTRGTHRVPLHFLCMCIPCLIAVGGWVVSILFSLD